MLAIAKYTTNIPFMPFHPLENRPCESMICKLNTSNLHENGIIETDKEGKRLKEYLQSVDAFIWLV